jgi:hypothetical protein
MIRYPAVILQSLRCRILFVCVGNPKPDETVVSEFDLLAALRTYFDKDDMSMISGITLGIGTFSSGDKGKAAAYVYSIEFLECCRSRRIGGQQSVRRDRASDVQFCGQIPLL